MPETQTFAQRVFRQPLLWPVLALVALLVINVVANPSFLDVRMQDGHLSATSSTSSATVRR